MSRRLEPGEPGYRSTDEGKRISDEYNMHRVADPYGSVGKWFMARLYDGSPVDHVLYDSKREAVLHAGHNEKRYVFVRIMPQNMTPEMADGLLSIYRKAADAGTPFADPEHAQGGITMINRVTQRDQYNQLAAMFGKGKPSNIIYGRN